MNASTQIASQKPRKRCAVYCRVSSDERLQQEFNSIDAQKEAGQAYVASQRSEGWIPVVDDYDDPGFSGGNIERPGLKRLMADTINHVGQFPAATISFNTAPGALVSRYHSQFPARPGQINYPIYR